MYSIIADNISRIYDHVDKNLDVVTYLSLLNQFENVKVDVDINFQNKYCRYWRLFGAGLNHNFRSTYFKLMEGLKGQPIPTIEEITRRLYEVPRNIMGNKTIQFSFASKLLHTLDPHLPIYDSMVASFYRFSVPGLNKSFDIRLHSFLTFYDFLVKEYRNVVSNDSRRQMIIDFRYRFSLPDQFKDEKIIDTLIWRVMDLRKKGLI